MAKKKNSNNSGSSGSGGSDAQQGALVSLLQRLLADMDQGGPAVSQWQVSPDLTHATRQGVLGGVDFAQTPIGPPMQPPMRGRPYTSYNRSRVPNQNTPGVGPMGNLPFYPTMTPYTEKLSFPPMYGMPRTPAGGSGPVVGEHFRFLPPTL